LYFFTVHSLAAANTDHHEQLNVQVEHHSQVRKPCFCVWTASGTNCAWCRWLGMWQLQPKV